MSFPTADFFIKALKSLPPSVQLDVYNWFEQNRKRFEELKKQLKNKREQQHPDELYTLSLDSFADDWDAPENDHWDQLYEQQQN